MAKPWTKKAHEKKALREKKKVQPTIEGKQVPGFPVNEFVGSLKNLLRVLNKENENVLVVDLKRSKVVYGTFPSEGIGKIVFDVYNYNGDLSSLEGAKLLSYIFKYTKSFFSRQFIGMNAYSKKGFIEIKAGNTPIRLWDFLDLEINPYGTKRLEDCLGDSNNRDQIILISTDTKTRKILRKVFEKISPYANPRTALDAKVLDNCEDYILNRLHSLSYSGKDHIYLKEDPRFANKLRIEDELDLLDKRLLDDKARFVTHSFLKNCGFSTEEANRLCSRPVNLKKAYDYMSNYLTKNPEPDYTAYKRGDWYYDYNLIVTAFIEYLRSQLNTKKEV